MSKRQSAGRAGAKAAFDMNAIYLSAAALEMARASVGSRVLVRANGRAHEFVVAGDLPGIAAGQAVAAIDIATAQWRFDRLGRLDRLDIKRAPATVHASLMRALSAALPRDARITGAENETQKRTQLSRAYRVNLEMLALVALVTGGFLVYSAQSLSAQTRQRQFALLRILGLQKESLRRQLLVEGLVLGIAGSILGLVLGYGFCTPCSRICRFGSRRRIFFGYVGTGARHGCCGPRVSGVRNWKLPFWEVWHRHGVRADCSRHRP